MAPWRLLPVAVAAAWLRTPWRHCTEVPGGGVDCGRLIRACFVGSGLVDPFDVPPYPADWMLHRSEELFLGLVERFMDPLPFGRQQSADVAVWRYGRCYSHGAIVVDWPLVIHAFRKDRCVTWADATKGFLAERGEPKIYTLEGRVV